MQRHLLLVAVFAGLVTLLPGCGIKRQPANVFPGSDSYIKRVESFKITPTEAYALALDAARSENKMQFLSRRPTVIVKRWYVFSMPQASGANLQGYHVHGDTGEVKFVNDKTVIPHSKR
ncbi:MAG: hypothetical protein LIP77_01940 [Planctomycetes bacterium]|nr:hypothetical protein [Planctomycetota bacterium]